MKLKPVLLMMECGLIGQHSSSKALYVITPDTENKRSNKGTDHLSCAIILIDPEAEIVKGDHFLGGVNIPAIFFATEDIEKSDNTKYYHDKNITHISKVIASSAEHIVKGGTGRREDGIVIPIPQLSEQAIKLLVDHYNKHKCMPESVEVEETLSKETICGRCDERIECRSKCMLVVGVPIKNTIKLNTQGEVDITISADSDQHDHYINKLIRFAYSYGMHPTKLSKRVGISEEEANKLLKEFKDKYQIVK